MYKYLLFGGDYYYPSGGIGDLLVKFNTFEELKSMKKHYDYDWFQLVNVENEYSYEEFNLEDLDDVEKKVSLLKYIEYLTK